VRWVGGIMPMKHSSAASASTRQQRLAPQEGGGIGRMTVKEIQIAIRQLTARDLAQFTAWFDQYREQIWDKQIEDDLKAGRLDSVLAEVDAEYLAGSSNPL